MAKKQAKTCASCTYAREDRFAGDDGWTAYECGNEQSEYYKSLLNVSKNGGRLIRITWGGCELWKGGVRL